MALFSALSEKLQGVLNKLNSKAKLSESNIAEAVEEVRLALLEADVNYAVTKTLIKKIKEKALGQSVLQSVTPAQQFIKIVHDELVDLMGGAEEKLQMNAKPAVIMLCGLQGAGKTTHAVKLAHYLQRQKSAKKPMTVACDLQRPAAIEQLKTLSAQAAIDCFYEEGSQDPVAVARLALEKAKQLGCDVVIVDTAGRLHIDLELMDQLEAIKKAVNPEEILFVANAAIGQDAVKAAQEFNSKMAITGSILTMLDGSTRGGAAISIREITGKPLKFEGIGEKLDDIQEFNPVSMADRILGMGDTINLVKRVQEHVTEDEAKKLEEKILKASFTYEDYLKQMQMVKKMGSLKNLLGMLPGMNALKEMDMDDKKLYQVEAIILSMTLGERQERVELSMNRRKRIARGSGTGVDDVNRLVKSFKQAKQFFKNMPNMKQMEKLMGGAVWR